MASIRKNFSLLFFGSDTFSIRILRHLINEQLCQNIQVVTREGTLLNEYSLKSKIKIYRWPLELNYLEASGSNIGLVASFGHLIEEKIVNYFDKGLFNVHPSLLPQYRGSTPVQAAIRDGLEETGCSIMKISPIPKFDIGDIVLQDKLSIREREYAIDLRNRLADLGANMFEKLLNNYDHCIQNISSQNDREKSYAKKLKLTDGLLKFKTETSEEIDRKVRAYTGFIELYTYCLNGLKVKLDQFRYSNEIDHLNIDGLVRSVDDKLHSVSPGFIYFHKIRHLLCFKCCDNKWVAFNLIKPERKPTMKSIDFYNGYLSKLNQINRSTDM